MGAEAFNGLSTMMTTSLTEVAGNAITIIKAVSPAAISVGAIALLIRLGWKTFKSLSHG